MAIDTHSRADRLKNPTVIDRTKEYKNEAGEVVPFGVTKTCTKCGQEKDLWSDFHMRSQSSDLHQPWCKKCVNASSIARKRDKQGGLLMKVPDNVKIHAGYGVSAPETSLPAKPVITPKSEPAPAPVDAVNEVTMETPAAVLEAVQQPAPAVAPEPEPTPAPILPAEPEPLPRAVETPRPSLIFREIVDFHDWATGPNSANSLFITRGFEALVELSADGKCVIATPNQKGPGRATDLDMTGYILKLLTGESTDEVLYGMVYRR